MAMSPRARSRSISPMISRASGRARLGADHPAVRFRSIADLPGS
jgi:hypothetical protein